jgi:hypothetical protein
MDYAKTENMGAWLRHPVLGDPSFDTFEKLGETVHRSTPPYEWAVNGSLFRDPADGAWYYFAGLYGEGYQSTPENRSDFKIYKSTDGGVSWQDLGRGFPDGFRFDGYAIAADGHPDTVMTYDPETKLYWLAYDWGTNESSWENAHNPTDKNQGSGGALAYAESPAGPFTRLPSPIFDNADINKKIGRFSRAYATTVLKRENDWIAFVLCDSNQYYSWGLVCMTALAPEGPWSEPAVLLSVDRPEYYPAPVEFHPCFAVGGTVYAPATSVARNRNYQTMHAAPLERAHDPAAWALTGDGNAWHARPLPDEHYGIWGQTYHGFVHDGMFTAMYPSRDEKGFGTLSVAQRPWDRPHSDGFTFSGHEGKSVSPLLRGYRDFALDAEFSLSGTIELVFDYHGVLGPDHPSSGACPNDESLSDYKALRISEEGNYALVSIAANGKEWVLAKGEFDFRQPGTVRTLLRVKDGTAQFEVNGTCGQASGMEIKGGPLALVAHEFSIMACTKFRAAGEVLQSSLRYNAYDALLGAGQNLNDWTSAAKDLRRLSVSAVIGSGNVYGKWNVTCDGFALYAPKGPGLGKARVMVDGETEAVIDLYSRKTLPSAPVYTCDLDAGQHSVAVYPESGGIVLDVLEVTYRTF